MANGIDGLDKLMKKYGSLKEVADHGVKKAVRQGTKIAQAGAVLMCPVNSGELRQKIKIKTQVEDDHVTGTVYVNAKYAAYVEFGTGPIGEAHHAGISPSVNPVYVKHGWGIPSDAVDVADAERYKWPKREYNGKEYYMTSGQPAQPFLYPGLKNNEEIICRRVNDVLAREIKKVCK